VRLMIGDVIVCAWAAPCNGPGWANQPIRLVVRNHAGEYREEWIQPDEQTERMHTLYPISAMVTNQLIREIERRYAELAAPSHRHG
jgi:hypothetical protein